MVRSDQSSSSTENSVWALESTLPSESRRASSWNRTADSSRTARLKEIVPAVVPVQREVVPSCLKPFGTWRSASRRRVCSRSIAALASQAATIPWSADSTKVASIRLRELPIAIAAATGAIAAESVEEILAPIVTNRYDAAIAPDPPVCPWASRSILPRDRMRQESPPASRSIPLGARPAPNNSRREREVSVAVAPEREAAPSRSGNRVHGARSPIRTETALDFHDRFRLANPPGVEWRQASERPESTSRRNETL